MNIAMDRKKDLSSGEKLNCVMGIEHCKKFDKEEQEKKIQQRNRNRYKDTRMSHKRD